MLFPRYVKDAPAELTRLDPARSLALLGEGGSILPTSDSALAEFLAWWGRLPEYRLSYGRLDEAAAAVRVLTDGLGASRNGAAPHPTPTTAFAPCAPQPIAAADDCAVYGGD